jgi:UDP-N-acetylmuramate dehydrogenase
VPGTVGGAVIGNAGAHGSDTSKTVSRVRAATPEGDVWLSADDLEYEYRSSIFKREPHPVVILRAEFSLREDDLEAIKARADEYNARRKRTQPPGATIGSMFKNPPGEHAGRLIEAAGLKGTRIGGAQISEKHANFFLNVEEATADDVKALVDLTCREVASRFGLSLELEVELVGEW